MLLAGAALFIIFMSRAAVAVPMVCGTSLCYGDFMGDTVTYVDVKEDSNSGDTLPLFGEPSVSGDSLDFDPVGFDANASGAGGNDTTDANLRFMVMAKPLHIIKNLTMSEAGDTTLSGFGNFMTFTSVTASVFVDILEIDGVGVNNISFNGNMVFSPSGGQYDLSGGGPLFHTIWDGSLFIDVMGVLDAAVANGDIPPYAFGATKISVNMDNTLTALSQQGTAALIAKKDAGGISITVNIPEPSSLALVGLGLLAIGSVRRFGR
jgi:hypothetical protein